jgi:hypothetical protein
MISHVASYFSSKAEVQKVIVEIPYGNFLIETRSKRGGSSDSYFCIQIDTMKKLKDKVNSDPHNLYVEPKLEPANFSFDAYEGMLLDAPHDMSFLVVAPPFVDIDPWSASLEWSSNKNAWIVK